MDEPDPGRTLRRQDASDAVSDLGWRYVLGTLRATVTVGAPAEAAEVAARLVAACGDEAASLSIDLRPMDAGGTLRYDAEAPPSGSWPTPRATRPASPPGRVATPKHPPIGGQGHRSNR